MRSQLRSYLRSLRHRRRVESEMESEMRLHLELRAADLERTGLAPAEALRQARIEFGGMEKHKEDMRASLGLRLFDELRADLRYAARDLQQWLSDRWRSASARTPSSSRWQRVSYSIG